MKTTDRRTASSASRASGAGKTVKKRTRRPSGSGPDLSGCGSTAARRVAAAILEVLAGESTPAQAASALGVSVVRYYHLERYGLEGLIAGCEPRPRGRRDGPEKQITRLQKQVAGLQRDLSRYQALARVAGKTNGLKKPRGRPRATGKRRPSVRALKVAGGLKQPPETSPAVADGAS